MQIILLENENYCGSYANINLEYNKSISTLYIVVSIVLLCPQFTKVVQLKDT